METTLARRMAALALALPLIACGGNDDSANTGAPAASTPASTPGMTLTITAREDMPGTYGNVGAYEKLTGTLNRALASRIAGTRIGAGCRPFFETIM